MDYSLFFELIIVAIKQEGKLTILPTDSEWWELYVIAQKQSLVGFLFNAIEGLYQNGQKPPQKLLLEWIGTNENIKAQNVILYNEAARLTKEFERKGHHTAILKGQANARLYPSPLCRQPGDIDIWVDGGKNCVVESLKELSLIDGELAEYESSEKASISYHHVHLKKGDNGIDVEVHFRPSSGNLNPFTNKRLQLFLEKEISVGNSLTPQGFYVPSIRFALVMQLAHIQRHLVTEGVGFRQIIDYYYLLKSDVDNQRDDVFYMLDTLGLRHMAGALMWVLHEKLKLAKDYLIAPMDNKRGQILLNEILCGGNFGRFDLAASNNDIWKRILGRHRRRFRLIYFDPKEVIWCEIRFIQFFIKSIPERIRRRSWSLGSEI